MKFRGLIRVNGEIGSEFQDFLFEREILVAVRSKRKGGRGGGAGGISVR